MLKENTEIDKKDPLLRRAIYYAFDGKCFYMTERKTHRSFSPVGCKRQKHLVVQIKSCMFALSV